eukprot:TRINITY_DN9784_c0_g1_i1.p1 TRINITY_DN9784_c0_g1~~TRINITY_DN9784_c0_g1_i1.p1  ORF type:complete len:829 (+),score=189.94 TRINITY_DN9784_c0_g1_i1:158-2644(+)
MSQLPAALPISVPRYGVLQPAPVSALPGGLPVSRPVAALLHGSVLKPDPVMVPTREAPNYPVLGPGSPAANGGWSPPHSPAKPAGLWTLESDSPSNTDRPPPHRHPAPEETIVTPTDAGLGPRRQRVHHQGWEKQQKTRDRGGERGGLETPRFGRETSVSQRVVLCDVLTDSEQDDEESVDFDDGFEPRPNSPRRSPPINKHPPSLSSTIQVSTVGAAAPAVRIPEEALRQNRRLDGAAPGLGEEMPVVLHFAMDEIDVRSVVILPVSMTADAAKRVLVERVHRRFGFALQPSQHVLRVVDDSLSQNEYVYGQHPLSTFSHFSNPNRTVSEDEDDLRRGCGLHLVPLTDVLEFLPAHDGGVDTVAVRPGSRGTGVHTYVRRKTTVAKAATESCTVTDCDCRGDDVVFTHLHTHRHRAPDGRIFTTTSTTTTVVAAGASKASKPGRVNILPAGASAGAGKEDGQKRSIVRGLVSKKKIRFQQDGYDLDLTYITPRIVAMGYPSVGREQFYRNPMSSVEALFEQYHRGHYKVYNLCSEANREYEPTRFQRSQARYPFPDHHPPPFSLFTAFCEDVHEYLSRDADNVVSVHCKAGKGRTGTMIAAYLIFSGQAREADEALTIYGEQRTKDGKGVTIPSQRRYVHYFSSFVNLYKQVAPPERCLVFHQIRLYTTPHVDRDGGCDPVFTVHQGDVKKLYDEKMYDSMAEEQPRHVVGQSHIDLKFMRRVVVKGDVKVVVADVDFLQTAPNHMFQFFFNTSFIPTHNVLFLEKHEVDGPHQDTKHKYFDAAFAVECTFRCADEDVAERTPAPVSSSPSKKEGKKSQLKPDQVLL